MRLSIHRLAAAIGSSDLKPKSMALLPPIQLYRRVLRAHRKHLPLDTRMLGDEYVKAEFRAHRKVDNPAHLIGFLTQWQLYAQQVEGNEWRDEKMDPEKLQKLSDEQVVQLYELMKAIQNRHDDDTGSGSESSS